MRGTRSQARARDTLMEELRDAVGDEAVDRTDIDVDRAVSATGSKTPEMARSRLLVVIAAALGVVVSGIVALLLHSWVVLALLLVLHAVVTTIVVGVALRTSGEAEKPAPATVARLEDEGVHDPEAALNELVGQTRRAQDQQDGLGPDR